MKAGDKLVIGGVELIAIIASEKEDFCGSCQGCYFYDQNVDDCRYSGLAECWDENTFEDIVFKEVR